MHLNVFWYTNEAGEVVAIDTAPYGEELDKETVFQAYERDIPASVETKKICLLEAKLTTNYMCP